MTEIRKPLPSPSKTSLFLHFAIHVTAKLAMLVPVTLLGAKSCGRKNKENLKEKRSRRKYRPRDRKMRESKHERVKKECRDGLGYIKQEYCARATLWANLTGSNLLAGSRK